MRRITRFLIAGAIVIAIAITGANAAGAQHVANHVTAASQVRELVLARRAEVLARIEATLSRTRDATAQAEPAAGASESVDETDPVEVDEAGGEEEAEGPEGGDETGAEGEEDEVLALPETGAGQAHAASDPAIPLMACVAALGALGIHARRRETSPAR